MNPGSVQATLAEAVRFARHRNDPLLAEDLEAAGRKIAAAIRAGDALIESAAPHPTDPKQHCVSVEHFDELSVALTALGGADCAGWRMTLQPNPWWKAAGRRDAAALESEFDAFCDEFSARINALIAECPERKHRATDTPSYSHA